VTNASVGLARAVAQSGTPPEWGSGNRIYEQNAEVTHEVGGGNGKTYLRPDEYTRLLSLAGAHPRDYAILQVVLESYLPRSLRPVS
jgi:hypothetical protein